VAEHAHPDLAEQGLGGRPGGHPGRGLAGAGPLQHRPGLAEAVLLHAGQVGVAGPGPGQRHPPPGGHRLRVRDRVGGHDLGPLGPLAVVDLDGQGRAQGAAVAEPAEDLEPVLLEAHALAAAVAEPSPGQLAGDLGAGQGHARRQPLEHGDQRRPVRLPGGEITQHRGGC
jgi:hypothetical protein